MTVSKAVLQYTTLQPYTRLNTNDKTVTVESKTQN